METVRKPLNEDRVALLLGSVIFILALLKFSGIDMLGWAVKIGMWVGDPLDAWRPATKGLLPGYGALFATYAILTGALACCVKLMGNDVVKFVKSFTIIFFIAMICYTLGANAYIAANPTQLKAQGIPWALGLSTEAGLILALVMGIVISNFMPNLAESLKDACRPELFVKIAIVIMGAELGVKAADAAGFAGHIIFRGLCAIVEAYLLYWCVVYYVAAGTSSSTANGRPRWRPASPSAAFPPPSPRARPSAPGPSFRSWFPRSSWYSPASKC